MIHRYLKIEVVGENEKELASVLKKVAEIIEEGARYGAYGSAFIHTIEDTTLKTKR